MPVGHVHPEAAQHPHEFAPIYEYYTQAAAPANRAPVHYVEPQFDPYYGPPVPSRFENLFLTPPCSLETKPAPYDAYVYQQQQPQHVEVHQQHQQQQPQYYQVPPALEQQAQYGRMGNQNGSMSLSTAFNLGLFAVFFLAIFPMFMISQGFERASISFVGTTRSLASLPFESMASLSYFHRSSSFWSGLVVFVILGVLIFTTWWALRRVKIPMIPRTPGGTTESTEKAYDDNVNEFISLSGDCVIPPVRHL